MTDEQDAAHDAPPPHVMGDCPDDCTHHPDFYPRRVQSHTATPGLLNGAAFAALGYLDGLYDRGAIDAQGLEVRKELRAAIRWNARRDEWT